MVNNESQAVAERLQKNIPLLIQWLDQEQAAGRWKSGSREVQEDLLSWLSTLPPDADEPISEAKCRELGGKDGFGCIEFPVSECFAVQVRFYFGIPSVQLKCIADRCDMDHIETVHQLRALLAALGVEANKKVGV